MGKDRRDLYSSPKRKFTQAPNQFNTRYRLSKIVTYQPEDGVREYLAHLLQKDPYWNISALDSVEETLPEANLYIIDQSHTGLNSLIEQINQGKCTTPVLITCAANRRRAACRKYTRGPLIEIFSPSKDVETFFLIIERMLKMSKKEKLSNNYCRIDIGLFGNTEEPICDVFIKINEEKYVKVFQRFEKIHPEALDRFRGKNCSHLYVKASDYNMLMGVLLKKVKTLDEVAEGNKKDIEVYYNKQKLASAFPIKLQEVVFESINTLGLTSKALEIANHAIGSALTIIGKNPKFNEILENSVKHEDYFSEHQFVLSFLCCAVNAKSPWKGQANNEKLALAAFFHDMGLKNRDLAKVQSLDDIFFEDLDPKSQEDAKMHPLNSVKIVEQIEGIPQDVSKIISLHHEKADGTGYPRGLDFKSIPPLAALFIVCHEIVYYICEAGVDTAHLEDIINDLKETNNKGNFKQVFEALEKVLLPEKNSIEAA